MRNIVRNPSANSSGVEKTSWPRYSVAIQLNILTPVGTAIRKVMKLKNGRYTTPGREHVVGPDGEAEGADGRRREDERLVAEQRLAAEDRQDLADDAHPDQDHDVDGRVRVEPEDVLPEDRVAAGRRVEEAAAVVAVDEQHDQGARQDRRREDDEDARDEAVQVRIGIRNIVIPGARILKIVTRKLTPPRIELVPMRMTATIQRSMPVPEYVASDERRIGRPAAAAAPPVDEEAGEHQDAGQRQHPERQGVDARERHVGCADLERARRSSRSPPASG